MSLTPSIILMGTTMSLLGDLALVRSYIRLLHHTYWADSEFGLLTAYTLVSFVWQMQLHSRHYAQLLYVYIAAYTKSAIRSISCSADTHMPIRRSNTTHMQALCHPACPLLLNCRLRCNLYWSTLRMLLKLGFHIACMGSSHMLHLHMTCTGLPDV